MPWVAPVVRSANGDTANDSPSYSRSWTVQANAGDLVALTISTSHQALIVSGVSGGGIAFTQNAVREKAASTANAYVYSGVSPTTQTFTLTVTFQNYVNATQYYNHVRWFVFESHSGAGYAGAWRGGGEPWMYANQSTEKSAYISTIIDWNATAATGNWIEEAGPVSFGYVFRGAAAIYWAHAHLNSTGLNQKRIGVINSTSTKFTQAALEIKGVYVDTAPPATVTGVTATPLNASQIRVDWAATSDDVGVTAYRVYDNGVQIAQVASNVLTFTHSGLAEESAHQYSVRALDAVGNISTVGIIAPATTFPLSVDKAFLGANKPSLRLGTTLVKKLYVGSSQVWP